MPRCPASEPKNQSSAAADLAVFQAAYLSCSSVLGLISAGETFQQSIQYTGNWILIKPTHFYSNLVFHTVVRRTSSAASEPRGSLTSFFYTSSVRCSFSMLPLCADLSNFGKEYLRWSCGQSSTSPPAPSRPRPVKVSASGAADIFVSTEP